LDPSFTPCLVGACATDV